MKDRFDADEILRMLGDARVLLCDADGCLFPSEGPAFEASAEVTNRFLGSIGRDLRFTPDELRAEATGRTFRATTVGLAGEVPADIEAWVDEERRAVIAHLAAVLRPDPDVLGPLRRLSERLELAAVSSSALARLDACFEASGIAGLIPPHRRFSAEDSLERPTSKPDPAVYLLALERLGVPARACVAIEDSPVGAKAAVAAGIRTIGNLTFVPAGEQARQRAALVAAGVDAIVSSWWQLLGAEQAR
jgi:beta-phosphoglucomutase-like phosphatase (HAD superfamily)